MSDGDGRMATMPIPPLHVHGALKCYTRECLEAIGGVQESRLGWDAIDETYARMRGFRTAASTTCRRPSPSAWHRRRQAARSNPPRRLRYVAHVGLRCGSR